MYRLLTPFQKNVLDADVKTEISWLFDVDKNGNGVIDYYWSTKDKSWDGDTYTFKIVNFTPINMQRGRADSGLQAPSAFTFTVSNKNNTLLPTDFDGGEVVLRLVIKAQLAFDGEVGELTFGDTTPEITNEGEVEVRVWRFQITGVDSAYQKLTFHCRDWLQKYLEGDYPNTAVVQALFVNQDDCCPSCAEYLEELESGSTHEHSTTEKSATFVVPLIFGRPTIPIRPVWLAAASKKLYMLGPKDGITYTPYAIRTPLTWHGEAQRWSTDDYTFNTASYFANDGNEYTFGEFIVVDTDDDGVADSNIAFGEDNHYYDIPCEYERDDTNTLTSPVDIIDYILQDWGVAASLIDATTKAAVKAVHAEWGLELHVGFWQQKTRKSVLAKLLAMSRMELIVRDKIYFKLHTKDIQHAVEKEWVIKRDDRGEGTFSSQALTAPQIKDSGYVVYQEQGQCLGRMLKVLIGAKGTTNDISGTTIRADFVQDQLIAQRIGILALQRLLLPKSTISFMSKGKCLQIECDDMIEIRPADYGAGTGEEYSVLVDSMAIAKDLSVRIGATRFSADLDDWEELSPVLAGVELDVTGTDVQRAIVSGPDARDGDGTSQIVNVIHNRTRIGSSITNFCVIDPATPRFSVYSGGMEKVRQGDLNGFAGYGVSTFGFAIYHDANNYLTFDVTNGIQISVSAANAITIKNGGDINLEAGGDVILAPSDANPALIKWSTVHNLGAATTAVRGLCFWPTTVHTGYFKVGYDPVNAAEHRYYHCTILGQIHVSISSKFDATTYSYVSARSDGAGDPNNVQLLNSNAGTTVEIQLSAFRTAFFPVATNQIDLGRATNEWKDGHFTGTVHANKFTDDGGGYDFFMPNPANPEKEMLRHWAIETDGLKTIYNGKGRTNNKGVSRTDLPSWFIALNDVQSCTIHLTPIGGVCMLEGEINDKGEFSVVSDRPDQEFSWIIIAIRGDKIGKKTIEDYPILERKTDA